MSLLKAIVDSFLLTPGIFVLAILMAGSYFLSKRHWKAGIINILIGAIMWMVSITPVSDLLISQLEKNFIQPIDPEGDVIILLGGGVLREMNDPEKGIPNPDGDMYGRILAAARLHKMLHLPIIVSGGWLRNSSIPIAEIARQILIEMGIPSDSIIMDRTSRDTYENARNTVSICRRLGYSKPILVTSAFHMKRAVMSFKSFNMDVIPYPTNFRFRSKGGYRWSEYLPSGFKDTWIALHEYIGLIYYRLAY